MVTKRKLAPKKSAARKKKPMPMPMPRMHLHSPSIDLPHFYQNVTPQQYFGVASNYGWEGPSIVASASLRNPLPVPARPVLRIRTARPTPAASARARPHPRAAASMRNKGPSFYDDTQDGMDTANSEFDTHPQLFDIDSPSYWNFYGGGKVAGGKRDRPAAYGPQVAFKNPMTDGLHFRSAKAMRRFYENEGIWEREGGCRSKPGLHAEIDRVRARMPKP